MIRSLTRRHEAVLVFAAWGVYGLLAALQGYVAAEARGEPTAWWSALVVGVIEAFLWAVTTLIIFELARRWPLDRGTLTRHVPIHALCAIGLALLRALVMVEISRHLGWVVERPFSSQFLWHFHTYLLFYWLLLGVAHAVAYYERLRDRDHTAERLAAGLTEARLHSLKMQLQPHFLFNTLHAISALIPKEEHVAQRIVVRLAEIFRNTLDYEAALEVTLREEIAFLEPYLEIEGLRLGERLRVEFDVGADTLEARVPHLVLQPLVENAIRHGIAPRLQPGRVRISARRSADGRRLQLDVIDDGKGFSDSPRSLREVGRHARRRSSGSAHDSLGSGIGLSNLRFRLAQLYGVDHRFEIVQRPEGGVRVGIEIPFRNAHQPSLSLSAAS